MISNNKFKKYIFECVSIAVIVVVFILILLSVQIVSDSHRLIWATSSYNVETQIIDGVNLYAAPANNPSGTIDSYSWEEIKEIAKLNLSAANYKSRYGIEVGQKKDNKYVLVDLDGNAYDGFIFMYDTYLHDQMNQTKTNDGGYKTAKLAKEIENLYLTFDTSLKNSIKQVSVKCNDVFNNKNLTNTCSFHVFLPSAKEVGFDINQLNEPNAYKNEGSKFDYFLEGRSSNALKKRTQLCSYSAWWLRSANSNYNDTFCFVYDNGSYDTYDSYDSCAVIACFVVG